LRREVLYHVAISQPVTARVREVQELYGLIAMLPRKVEARQVDFDRFQPLLKRAHDLIAGIKDNWLKVTGGRRELLVPIAQGLSELKSLAAGLHEPALADLVAALEGVAAASTKSGSIPEVLAMEFATGLLLVEDATAHFARLSDEFPKQVEAMRRRLDFAQRGVLSLPAAEEDLLDETARRAQERMLLRQVAREIQGNLRHVEKVLDAFFRDSSEAQRARRARHLHPADPGCAADAGTDRSRRIAAALPEADRYLRAGRARQQRGAGSAGRIAGGPRLLHRSSRAAAPDAARLLDPFMRRRLGLEAPAPIEIRRSIRSNRRSRQRAKTSVRSRPVPGRAARIRRCMPSSTTCCRR
jgi:hypothetical protein